MKTRTHFVRLAVSALALVSATSRADVMLQGFYWDVPSPAAGQSGAEWWWDKVARESAAWRQAGFTSVWLSNPMKGHAGGYSMGYDPFDDYDLGSKDQQWTYTTRFGTREKLQRACAYLRANGLNIILEQVHNHRNGDDGFYNFRYRNAYGQFGLGRFGKGPGDFHPNVPQCPNVFDSGESFALFGRDVAHVTGNGQWMWNGLIASTDWITKALDVQGYRLDYVKGISTDWLKAWLNSPAVQGKFSVGEFFDYDLGALQYWKGTMMQNRVAAFDFPLRGLLREMCLNPGGFDMRQLDHGGLAGVDPYGAVTFVENHDTDRHDPISARKMMAYAYILTSEGYPKVFYRDYSDDPGCYGLKSHIDELIWIRRKIAQGGTLERWKNERILVYERLGGSRLLVGLNNQSGGASITCQTGFPANTRLVDYTGNAPDVWTDSQSRVTLNLPGNGNGQGYVAYSVAGFSGGFDAPHTQTTQEYAGATDLDIKPAEPGVWNHVARIEADHKPIRLELYMDRTGWSRSTYASVRVLDQAGRNVGEARLNAGQAQGNLLKFQPPRRGWLTLQIQLFGTRGLRSPYWLKATYYAPREAE